MASSVGGAWDRRCRTRKDVDGVFREEAEVGHGREQQFGKGILLDHTVISRVGLEAKEIKCRL